MEKNQEPRTQNQLYSYRNLILRQKAQDLTLEVVKIVAQLPRDPAAQVIARQIVASSSSIAANIAEGHGRFTLPAHRNHLSIAKGSACETDGWLDLLCRADYLDSKVEQRLHVSCDELIRMLTAKILQLERLEQSKKRVREEPSPYSVEDYASPSRF